jgi:hypothetical protein
MPISRRNRASSGVRSAVAAVLREARDRGWSRNLDWGKANNILYGALMDVDKELWKYFLKRER